VQLGRNKYKIFRKNKAEKF